MPRRASHFPARITARHRPVRQVALRVACLALALLGSGGAPAADAAEPDVVVLQGQVKALSALVERLQARVDRLERQADPVATPASGALGTAPAPAPREVLATSVRPAPATGAAPVAPLVALRPDQGAGDASPQAQLRIDWARIAPGMTSGEVAGLLGEPTRRLTLDGRTVWYYAYPALGNGSIFFTDAGRVSSRQSPFPWGG